jgi:hypothetical protein
MKGGGSMKFMTLVVEPVEKAAEVSAAADKVWANVPKGSRPDPIYVMLCIPKFDVPPNSLVAFTISEAESADAIAARMYPQMLAGATLQAIPLLEVPVVGAAKAEKKYRG